MRAKGFREAHRRRRCVGMGMDVTGLQGRGTVPLTAGSGGDQGLVREQGSCKVVELMRAAGREEAAKGGRDGWPRMACNGPRLPSGHVLDTSRANEE